MHKKKKEMNVRENQRELFSYTGCPFSYYGQCFDYKKSKRCDIVGLL